MFATEVIRRSYVAQGNAAENSVVQRNIRTSATLERTKED
jgi:hypothetical protein